MGIFVNDRAWNLKKAKENYDWEQWHLKRSQEAVRKGDISSQGSCCTSQELSLKR